MLTLAAPIWLVLAIAPLVVRWLAPPYALPRSGVAVPFLDRLVRLAGRAPSRGGIGRPPRGQRLVVWGVWLLTIAALARPQWLEPPITRTVPTRDLLLAIDLSGSMETKDFTNAAGQKVDRLAAVKDVLDDFLARRHGDRVAIIFFGSAPFVQTTFTEDLDACRELLDEAQVRMAGPKTVLGDAIGLGLTVFEKESQVQDRVMIVLTDGNDTGSQVPPERAARIAHDRGITIHAVAVGDPKAAGEEKLDEVTLEKIAQTTGGRYAHASDRMALEQIYRQLDALRTRPAETMTDRPRRDLFFWPLGLAFLMTLAYHAVSLALAWRQAGTPFSSSGAAAAAVLLGGTTVVSSGTIGTLHLLRPWWLAASVPGIGLLVGLARRADPMRGWRQVMAPEFLQVLRLGAAHSVRWGPIALLGIGWLLSIVALTGPAWRQVPSPFSRDEAALVLVMKVTPEMLARDIQPSRLARAAEKISDLLARRPGTKGALVAYAGSAHLVMPMTHDAALLARFAADLAPDLMPVAGDDPAAALRFAREQLVRAEVPGSILLLADSVPENAFSGFAKDWSNSGVPTQILAIAAPADVAAATDGPSAPALDLAALRREAARIGASVTVVTPDETDIASLAARTVTRLVTGPGETSGDAPHRIGQRCADEGYFLLFPLAALTLLWFRPGWFVPEAGGTP